MKLECMNRDYNLDLYSSKIANNIQTEIQESFYTNDPGLLDCHQVYFIYIPLVLAEALLQFIYDPNKDVVPSPSRSYFSIELLL